MRELLKNKTLRKNFKKMLAIILVLIITFTSVNLNSFMKVKAATTYKTLYFIDNTAEQWIKNDSAMMELVDNTNGHDSYWMTQKDDVTWYVNVPESAYNITFNRYSSDKSTKWNSWSAGGRDENNAYYADGAEYGHWDVVEEGENYFHAGDIIYLDLSEFPDWEKDNALMYINFSDASKEENGGNDINISSADKKLYDPKLVDWETADSVYAYIVTYEDEGASELRFWRGNELTLWNYSVTLSYEDYLNGMNCVKVTGWNNSGSLEVSECSIDFELDSDEDGISDYLETIYGLNKNSMDSDNDGLEDAQELQFTKTNPLKYDSLEEGVSDADADRDGDGVSNLEEINLGLNPCSSDTDEDGLKDGDEINLYETDPKSMDTDGDALSDSDDMALGFSPLLEDTDGNGILDGDEKRHQSLDVEINNSEKTEVKKVSVAFEGTGYINSTTSIEDLYGKDISVSKVVGLVGVPVEITSSSKFDTAMITFYLDEELDSETLSNLIVMWYDEENGRFIEQETVIDEENRTASANVEHFSKYMLVDYRKWFESWKKEISYYNGVSYDVILAIDCSGSMIENDPNFIYEYRNTLYPGSRQPVKTCYRKLAAENFIYTQGKEDRTGVILFSLGARLSCPLTNDKGNAIDALDNIYSEGGTNYNNVIRTSVDLLTGQSNDSKKMILLLSDGEADIDNNVLNYAITNDVIITTIYMGSNSENATLKNIAAKTGGEYYKAITGDEIINIFTTMSMETRIDKTDTDGDGLYDVYEEKGMRIDDSNIIYLDPLNPDCDGDGLLDGEEIDPVPTYCHNNIYDENSSRYDANSYIFKMYTNPEAADSDGDGLLDGKPFELENGTKIAPKDPDPKFYTGPTGMWLEQIAQLSMDKNDEKYAVAHELTSWYFDGFAATVGAFLLSFPADETGKVVHSHIAQWQAIGGYNIIYDLIFDTATNGNMKAKAFPFISDGEEFIIWAWKGDYLNLGAGAEIGIYFRPTSIFGSEWEYYTKQWFAPLFQLPMKLYLYNYSDGMIENVFLWEPYAEQWWITGFRPEMNNPDVEDMICIGTIDFKGREELYEGLKESVEGTSDASYWIFDEDGHTAWFFWDR